MIRSLLLSWLTASTLILAAPPPLPTALTSFGAATCEDAVYVYGGHKGKAHDYSTATVNGSMWRLSLNKPEAWEAMPDNVPMQSPGLAAWNGKIYLAGGMQPQNEPGAADRLVSMAHTAVFDPVTKSWEKMTPLPEPRSSHAVAVLDGRLYAIGGWPLNIGKAVPKDEKPAKKYHDTMVVLDLTKPGAGWETLPQPWQRRALIAVPFNGKIWCLGGMTESNELSSEVNVYDPTTKQWSPGPDVPATGQVKAFGCAACATKSSLFASPEGGSVYRLSPDGKAWTECGKLTKPRFFHQLAVIDETHLMAIGGTHEGRPMDDVEIITVEHAKAAQ